MSMTDAEIREALARAERAYEELMRVTGMGKYAKRVQGGPPNPPRCSIPARPDYDTDLLIGEALEDSKRLAADLLAARAERDEARAAHESERRVYGEDVRINATRAETAEARCRELEGVLAWSHRQAHSWIEHARMCFDAVPSSDDVAFLARGDALLSPPPPHTCQMSRATSGASDCGLEPCEEAKVHMDRGASRPATVRRAVPAVAEKHGPYCPKNPDATVRHMVDFCTCGPTPAESATPEAAKCATCDGCGVIAQERDGYMEFNAKCPTCCAPHGPDCHGCGGGA